VAVEVEVGAEIVVASNKHGIPRKDARRRARLFAAQKLRRVDAQYLPRGYETGCRRHDARTTATSSKVKGSVTLIRFLIRFLLLDTN
jgi:hypothetical protein